MRVNDNVSCFKCKHTVIKTKKENPNIKKGSRMYCTNKESHYFGTWINELDSCNKGKE